MLSVLNMSRKHNTYTCQVMLIYIWPKKWQHYLYNNFKIVLINHLDMYYPEHHVLVSSWWGNTHSTPTQPYTVSIIWRQKFSSSSVIHPLTKGTHSCCMYMGYGKVWIVYCCCLQHESHVLAAITESIYKIWITPTTD